MTLPHHHRTAPSGTAMPLWSLTLPRWGAAPRTESPPIAEPRPQRWTCAACGAVLSDIGAATAHVETHGLREGAPQSSARRAAARARARRHHWGIPGRARGRTEPAKEIR